MKLSIKQQQALRMIATSYYLGEVAVVETGKYKAVSSLTINSLVKKGLVKIIDIDSNNVYSVECTYRAADIVRFHVNGPFLTVNLSK